MKSNPSPTSIARHDNKPVLHIKNLSIGFYNGKQPPANYAVKEVNLSLNPGKSLALVGESGSGKTLTALSPLQLLPLQARVSQESAIFFNGVNLLTLAERDMRKLRGNKISLVFQDALSALNPVLKIGLQLKEVLRLHTRLTISQRHQKALSLLKEVGLPDPHGCLRSYPHQLSGGMKQRVLIAIALAAQPQLLIADEPTTALDVTVQAQILTLLKTLQKRYKMALLFISHDLGVVQRVADQVAVMYKGEIVENKPARLFFSGPKHPYSQQLFEAMLSRTTATTHAHSYITSSSTAMLPPTPLLRVDNLVVQFTRGINAIDKVSFSLGKGQTLALIGESGSGKTTTGRAILQLIPYQSGAVHFEDKLLHPRQGRLNTAQRQAIQVIFQDSLASLNPRMTIARLLEEGLKIHKIGRNAKERQQHIESLLKAVEMPIDCQSRYPHEFSGGQRQRLCIARALSVKPKLIVCDEPTSALDVCTQKQILGLLQKLQQQEQLSYLLITHDFSVVAKLAHYVAVMHQGKIVEYGAVDTILNTPQHPYTQRLLLKSQVSGASFRKASIRSRKKTSTV